MRYKGFRCTLRPHTLYPHSPMALPSGIKRRGNTYSARYALPRPVQRAVGKHDMVQALSTNSLSEAVELAAPIIAGWKAWALAMQRGTAKGSPEDYVRRAEVAHRLIRDGIDQWSPELITERAREGHAMVGTGSLRPIDVQAQFDNDVDRYVAQQEQAGEQIDALGVQRAYRASQGQLGTTVAESMDSFLAERIGDLTAQSHGELEKRCRAFVSWVGRNVEIATITRATAG